jgi:hypothetical protein
VTGTVGNVGRPRAVRVHSLLEELRAAIEHNARLVDDATAKLRALDDLERREREVAEAERRVDAKLAKVNHIRQELDNLPSRTLSSRRARRQPRR